MLKFNTKKDNCPPEQTDKPSDQPANGTATAGDNPDKPAEAPKQERPNFGMDPDKKTAQDSGNGGWFVVYAAPFVFLLLFGCLVCQQFLLAAQGNLAFWPFEHVDCVRQAIASNSLVAPMALSFVQWPGYVWLVSGIQTCLPPDLHRFLFPIVTVVQGAFLLLSLWGLCKGTRLGASPAFVCCLLLLASPVLVLGISSVLPHSLATALLLLSLTCFHAGWLKDKSWFCLPLGFVLAGLAGLSGGFYHVLLPCLASVLFVLWRGRFKRLQDFDGLLGFVLMLLILAGWLLLVILGNRQGDYLAGMTAKIFQLPFRDIRADLQVYAWAVVALVPILAVVLGVSWWNVCRHAWADICASRTQAAGTDFLWISLVVGLLLTPFFRSENHLGIAFCLACLALPLLAKALPNLSLSGQRAFFCTIACLATVLGSALLMLSFDQSHDWLMGQLGFSVPAGMKEMVLAITSLPIAGVCSVVFGLALLRLAWKLAPMANAIICMAYWCLLHQYACLMIVPEAKAFLLN